MDAGPEFEPEGPNLRVSLCFLEVLAEPKVGESGGDGIRSKKKGIK